MDENNSEKSVHTLNTDQASSTDQVIPYVTLQSESSSQIGIKLTDANYRLWSQVLEMHVASRDKYGYLTGDTPEPKKGDPKFGKWKADNALVKSWLINSMSPHLMGNFIQLPTAKEVWDTVARTYHDGSDSSQIYELMKKAFQMRQDGRPLSTYYSALNAIFMELDYRRPSNMKDPDDVTTLKKRTDDERVYIFLAGLDSTLDQVRSRVLSQDPLPDLEGTYSLVRKEAQRQLTMITNSAQEGSALVVKKPQFRPSTTLFVANSRPPPTVAAQFTSPNPGNQKCSHCNRSNHDRESCWKLNGYPEWFLQKQAQKKANFASQAHHTFTGVSNIAQPSTSFVVPSTSQVSPDDAFISSAHSGNFGIALHTSPSPSTKPWIIDSGASDHMTNDPSRFVSFTIPYRTSVRVANGVSTPVQGAGTLPLTSNFSLSSVLHVPNLSSNLLSISQITKSLNCFVTFFPTHCVFQDILTKATIGHGKERGGLYYLEESELSSFAAGSVCQVVSDQNLACREILLWHRRLGHPSFTYLKRLFPTLFSNVDVSNLQCEHCILAKNHRVSFPLSFNKCDVPFSIVHTDVWGPFSIPTSSGAKWFISFIDDCTRVCWVYLMKSKSDVSTVLPMFYQMVCTQFQTQTKIFRSDNGREYLNHTLTDFFQHHGILHQTSCAYSPQQNGIAERKNRHLLEVARSLCFTMHVPKHFWGDAVLTAAFLINRMPSRVLNFQTPLRVLSTFHSLPSLLNLPPRVFGCVGYVHVHALHRDKFDPRALKCVFLGYSSSQKGYRCFHPPSRKFFVSMDVSFCEQEAYFSRGTSPLSIQGEIVNEKNEELLVESTVYENNEELLVESEGELSGVLWGLPRMVVQS